MNKNIRTLLALFVVVSLAGCTERADVDIAQQEDQATMAEVTDKSMAIGALEENAESFHAMVDGLSPEQLAFRESPDRWSIAEVAEHIVTVEGMLNPMVAGVLESEPSTVAPDSTVTDEAVIGTMKDRTNKMTAPPEAVPTGKYTSADEILAAFDSVRDMTLGMVETTSVDLRTVYGEYPPMGTLDGAQWLLFIASHSDRHVAQMQQVKDDANYPRDVM